MKDGGRLCMAPVKLVPPPFRLLLGERTNQACRPLDVRECHPDAGGGGAVFRYELQRPTVFEVEPKFQIGDRGQRKRPTHDKGRSTGFPWFRCFAFDLHEG